MSMLECAWDSEAAGPLALKKRRSRGARRLWQRGRVKETGGSAKKDTMQESAVILPRSRA